VSRSWTDARVRAPHRSGGFSLLEVLVAFVILALVGTSLFRLFSGALGNAGAADDYSRAVLVAESVLAETAGTLPLREGSKTGTTEDGQINWTASVSPYAAPQVNPDVDAGSQLMQVRLFQVTAEVTFPAIDGKPRTFKLSTLRLGARDAK
jgi:general secretion pathway protein I